MIYYDVSSFWMIVFRLRGGFISRNVLMRALLACMSGTAAAFCVHYNLAKVSIFSAFIGQVSFLVTLLLSFRLTNAFTSYDTGLRSLRSMISGARQMLSMMSVNLKVDSQEERRSILLNTRRILMCILIMLVKHIREDAAMEDLLSSGILTKKEYDTLMMAPAKKKSRPDEPNYHQDFESEMPKLSRPIFAFLMLQTQIHAQFENGHITEAISLKMMDVAREMADAFGAMARIAGTPIPFNYAQFIKTLVVLSTSVSPWSYASQAEWFTPALAFLVGLLLYGAENLAQEVEQPFGDDWNDVDLFKRVKGASDELSDILTFALGDPHVDRYHGYFTHHRLERRVSNSSSFKLHRDVDSFTNSRQPSTASETTRLLPAVDESVEIHAQDAALVTKYSRDSL